MYNTKYNLIGALLVVMSIHSTAIAQTDGSHGGDAIAMEAYQFGAQLNDQIRKLSDHQIGQLGGSFNAALFEDAFKRTRFTSTNEELIYKNAPVDAINDTSAETPKITFNRPRWLQYDGLNQKKEEITLHEILGVVKKINPNSGEWDEYSLSNQIVKILDQLQDPAKKMSIAQIEEKFKTSEGISIRENIKAGLTYSCLEYSGLNEALNPKAIYDAYHWNQRALPDTDSDWLIEVKQPQTEDLGTEIVRVDTQGNLIVKAVYREIAKPVYYRYCSSAGNESIRMTRFLADSIDVIFNTSLTPEYADFIKKHELLVKQKAYKKCITEKDAAACVHVYKELDKIKLKSESNAQAQARDNFKQINAWMNQLGIDRTYLSAPILNTFNAYVQEQDYLKSIIDLDDVTDPNQIDLVNAYIHSLKTRIPMAYQSSRLRFKSKAHNEIESFILGWEIK